MSLQNSEQAFGWVSRMLHWIMALAIIAMLPFGAFIEDMEPALSNIWLYSLHKTIGITLLTAIILRIIWHRISPPPPSITDGIPKWQITASHTVHVALYVLMLAVPLTGYIASAATGIDVVIYGSITVPSIVPVSESIEELFFTLHGIVTKLLLLSIVLHVAGALQRHFVRRDNTLRRMLRG